MLVTSAITRISGDTIVSAYFLKYGGDPNPLKLMEEL
ncbi:hypothetical protein lwe2407 [Listeria welshimeri serovar 6b str. SLCC5334]|uniref:Uncharacterized protein n=1 Tax=Listeria welshimeri serovar 6b (strain ATCC 35897 / DSM 20650 / CCUG 15529 / CIP 8149 / NCTC 11857 / SLCC 5334 / V8) TaxID=386043 RepID=A0ALE3_LISW6|nr:hypothetical protein lwe2407 [Listeria welshimeri serovar 6b str. SLCC5334]